MTEAVLFDWGMTLAGFEWSDALLAAGHLAGFRELGREDEAAAFTARFEREKLPALLSPGASERLDYGTELRDLLGPLSDEDLDRYLDAEHAAWRPARSLAPGAGVLLESLREQGVRLAIVANTWPDPPRLVRRELDEHGVAGLFEAIVLSGEVGVRKPDPAIFELALEALGVDAFDALFVGDRLIDDVQGAAAVGLITAQALWFHADEAVVETEPDYLALTVGDVAAIVREFGQ